VRALALCAILAALAPALAHAEPPLDRPLTGTRYTASLTAATEFWHATPDCRVRFFAATPDELQAFTGVSSEAATYQGVQGDECPVWITEKLTERGLFNRLRTCLDGVHEVGHRLDFEHTADPASIMNPWVAPMPWPCAQRFLPRGMGGWFRDFFPAGWATRPD
jgi:hypothetical protein